MPEEKERPRPHGDPLERPVCDNPEAQRQSDAAPDEVPRDTDRDFRVMADRARGRRSSAHGIPEFDEDAGALRRRQYEEAGGIVSETD
jgi:hypothetical protein